MALDKIRVAALADVHVNQTTAGALQPLFTQVGSMADIFLLAGDLTDYGLPRKPRRLCGN